jgi:hypothetical protein
MRLTVCCRRIANRDQTHSDLRLDHRFDLPDLADGSDKASEKPDR